MLFRRVLLVLLLEPHCRSKWPSIHHIVGDKRRTGTFPPKIYNHITSAYELQYTIGGTGLTQLGTNSCTTYIHKVARHGQSGAGGSYAHVNQRFFQKARVYVRSSSGNALQRKLL